MDPSGRSSAPIPAAAGRRRWTGADSEQQHTGPPRNTATGLSTLFAWSSRSLIFTIGYEAAVGVPSVRRGRCLLCVECRANSPAEFRNGAFAPKVREEVRGLLADHVIVQGDDVD